MTSSNCSHRRSHRIRGNLCSPDLDNLDNRDSRRNRAKPIFRPAAERLRFLCQRHRSSLRSRPRSPPRRARVGEST